MPVSVTVAPSPKRQKHLAVAESHYLVALATSIAEDHPDSMVTAQYGHGRDDVMVIRPHDDAAVELF